MAYQPFQNLRQGVARDVLEQLDALRGVRAGGSSHEDVDRVHGLAIDLRLGSEQTDVGDGVIAAAGRTPGPVDPDGLPVVHFRLERPRDRERPALRLDHREIAEFDAGAAHESPHDL